jgi:hypothetical protein
VVLPQVGHYLGRLPVQRLAEGLGPCQALEGGSKEQA